MENSKIDKTQERCELIKEHFGNGSFYFKPVSKNDQCNQKITFK